MHSPLTFPKATFKLNCIRDRSNETIGSTVYVFPDILWVLAALLGMSSFQALIVGNIRSSPGVTVGCYTVCMKGFRTGLKYLYDECPRMRGAMDMYGRPKSRKRDPGFATLVRIIVDQQVSVQAGAAIWARLLGAVCIWNRTDDLGW